MSDAIPFFLLFCLSSMTSFPQGSQIQRKYKAETADNYLPGFPCSNAPVLRSDTWDACSTSTAPKSVILISIYCNFNIQLWNNRFMPSNMTGNHVFNPREVDARSSMFQSPNVIWLSFSFFILLSLWIFALKYGRGDTTKHSPFCSPGPSDFSTSADDCSKTTHGICPLNILAKHKPKCERTACTRLRWKFYRRKFLLKDVKFQLQDPSEHTTVPAHLGQHNTFLLPCCSLFHSSFWCWSVHM